MQHDEIQHDENDEDVGAELGVLYRFPKETAIARQLSRQQYARLPSQRTPNATVQSSAPIRHAPCITPHRYCEGIRRKVQRTDKPALAAVGSREPLLELPPPAATAAKPASPLPARLPASLLTAAVRESSSSQKRVREREELAGSEQVRPAKPAKRAKQPKLPKQPKQPKQPKTSKPPKAAKGSAPVLRAKAVVPRPQKQPTLAVRALVTVRKKARVAARKVTRMAKAVVRVAPRQPPPSPKCELTEVPKSEEEMRTERLRSVCYGLNEWRR